MDQRVCEVKGKHKPDAAAQFPPEAPRGPPSSDVLVKQAEQVLSARDPFRKHLRRQKAANVSHILSSGEELDCLPARVCQRAVFFVTAWREDDSLQTAEAGGALWGGGKVGEDQLK